MWIPVALLMFCAAVTTTAQNFSLETKSDTLSFLQLSDGHSTDRWRLPFPVYQLCVGDVDGDGIDEAIVGVIKTTRFDPNKARRLFIFKNHHGRIRAMWMGSQLGGILRDFRFVNGHVLTLQTTTDNRYVVLEHIWRKFGLGAGHFLAKGVDEQEALRIFYHQ